ncbi:MAG: helix-turn-helix transcriptional regulator, partial [Steroidobacteraceae bacterium]
ITADTALRLGIYFNMDARFWLNLQAEYDMRIASRDTLKPIAGRSCRGDPSRSATIGGRPQGGLSDLPPYCGCQAPRTTYTCA